MTIAAIVGLYLAAMCVLALKQRIFIYPAAGKANAVGMHFAGFREVTLVGADGVHLRSLYQAAAGGLPTLVFFHGNGDSLIGSVAATDRLAAAGYGLLLPEYRGYGGNAGSPTESGLYLDGEAALDWLRKNGVNSSQIVVIGNSLGSGVATEMAVRYRLRGLILISGFTSLPDIAAQHLRVFPARLLLIDRYENERKMPFVSSPHSFCMAQLMM